MMLAISILALLVGLALLALGLRGRVIDNHPLCRKCGFDLTGRSPDSTRCPECGAELSLPKAICIGHRKPRSFSLSLGCLLFGVAACGIFFQFSAIQWTRYAPTWWLIHRIDSADTVARDEAVAELDLRIIAGNVSSARALDLVDRILALQADLKKTWVENWGTLVEDAHVRKQVPDDRWNRYLLQAPRLALDVRSDIRIGDPVPFMVRCEQARLGAGTKLFLEYEAPTLIVGPLTLPAELDQTHEIGARVGGGGVGRTFDLKPAQIAKLSPGPVSARIALMVQLHEDSGTGFIAATGDLELKAPVRFVAADNSTVTIIDDQKLRPEITKSISIGDVTYGKFEKGTLSFGINVHDCPVQLGFDLFVLLGGKEIPAGHVAIASHGHSFSAGRSCRVMLPDFTADRVTVRFKPSTAAAAATTDTFSIWNGEIIIRDVPVTRFPPTTRIGQ